MDDNLVNTLIHELSNSRYLSKNPHKKEVFSRWLTRIDYPMILNVESNSVFFIEAMNWDNQDENGFEFNLKAFIHDLAGECVNYEIMSQSWRLFSVITYLLVQGRRVQATSLMDSCFRLAIINYAFDGDLENCQSGLNLLWQVPGNGNYTASLEEYYNELSLVLKCDECLKQDKEHKNKYPCYDVLHYTPQTIFSHFLQYWFSEKTLFYVKDLNTIRDSYFLNSKKQSWKGMIEIDKDKKKYCFNDNYPVFSKGCLRKSKTLEEITKIRNVLAHGNFKEPKDPDGKIYNESMALIDERICSSFRLLFDYLLFLTKDAYVEHDGKIITGRHLFFAFHELDNYEDKSVSIFQDPSIVKTYSFAKHQRCENKPLIKYNRFETPPRTVAWTFNG